MTATDNTGRSYLPRNQKSRAMLAILALSSPRLVLRRRIAELLWSQRGHEQAQGSLRQSIGELHRALGEWGYLFVRGRRHLSLAGVGLEIDTRNRLPTLSGDVLLEDMTGLDPAFDRWLADARSRFPPSFAQAAEGVAGNQARSSRMFGWLVGFPPVIG